MWLFQYIGIRIVRPFVAIGFICAHYPVVWHLQSSIISMLTTPVAIESLCACPLAVGLLQSTVFKILGPPCDFWVYLCTPWRCGACRVSLSELLTPKWRFSLLGANNPRVVVHFNIAFVFLCTFGSPWCCGMSSGIRCCCFFRSFLFSFFFSDVFSSGIWSSFAGLSGSSLNELSTRLKSAVLWSKANGTTDA